MSKTLEYLKGYYMGKREIYQELDRIVHYSRLTDFTIDVRVYVRNMEKYITEELVEKLDFALDMVTIRLMDNEHKQELQEFFQDLDIKRRK